MQSISCVLFLITAILSVQVDARLKGTYKEQATTDGQNNKGKKSTRIVGGAEVPTNQDYPFFVNLGACAGALIHGDIVLTAAHCTFVVGSTAQVGAHERGSTTDDSVYVQVLKEKTHPEYNTETHEYDFRLLKLERWVNKPLASLNRDSTIPRNENSGPLTVLGMGRTEEDGNVSSTLLSAEVYQINSMECQDLYPEFLINNEVVVCAAGQGRDSCDGDSAAPLLSADGSVIGLVSWGLGCAREARPGVYSRLSAGYEWIQETICYFSEKPPLSCGVSKEFGNSTFFGLDGDVSVSTDSMAGQDSTPSGMATKQHESLSSEPFTFQSPSPSTLGSSLEKSLVPSISLPGTPTFSPTIHPAYTYAPHTSGNFFMPVSTTSNIKEVTTTLSISPVALQPSRSPTTKPTFGSAPERITLLPIASPSNMPIESEHTIDLRLPPISTPFVPVTEQPTWDQTIEPTPFPTAIPRTLDPGNRNSNIDGGQLNGDSSLTTQWVPLGVYIFIPRVENPFEVGWEVIQGNTIARRKPFGSYQVSSVYHELVYVKADSDFTFYMDMNHSNRSRVRFEIYSWLKRRWHYVGGGLGKGQMYDYPHIETFSVGENSL